jgi:hypothetical protein
VEISISEDTLAAVRRVPKEDEKKEKGEEE